MTMTAGEIERLITQALPDSTVSITDLEGDGNHYACHVVSHAFIGKTRIEQHKMVYDALGGRMGSDGTDALHALALQTAPPKDA